MWEQIISTAFGIIIGTVLVMFLGTLFIPIMFKMSAHKIITQLGQVFSTEENKGEIRHWFEEVIRDGIRDVIRDHVTEETFKDWITDALHDKEVRHAVETFLRTSHH